MTVDPLWEVLMTPHQARRLARELRIFFVCCLVGVFVVPLVVCLILGPSLPAPFVIILRDVIILPFCTGLRPAVRLMAAALILGPYVAFQLIRSIIWSLKMLRGREA